MKFLQFFPKYLLLVLAFSPVSAAEENPTVLLLRKLLWFDCSAAFTAGLAVLLLVEWLARVTRSDRTS